MKRYHILMLLITSFLGLKAQQIHLINASNVMKVMKTMEAKQNEEGKKAPGGSNNMSIQIGQKNTLDVNLLDDQIRTIQLGSNNFIHFKDEHFDKQPTGGNTIQIQLKGEANRAEVRGSNSISNGMSIEVIGTRSLIEVKNYK